MIDEYIKEILTSPDTFQVKTNKIHDISKKALEALAGLGVEPEFKKLSRPLKDSIENFHAERAKIEKVIAEYEAVSNLSIEILEQNKILRKKEEELRILNQKLEANKMLESVIETINEKQRLLEPQVSEMLTKLQNINQAFAADTNSLEEELIDQLAEAERNLVALQDIEKNSLNKLSPIKLESCFKHLVDKVIKLTEEHNLYVGKIESVKKDLEEISVKHDKVIETFKIHKLENDAIFGALESREGVLNYVRSLSKEIEERLQKFDDEIREIVRKRDQLPIYQLAEMKKYEQ